MVFGANTYRAFAHILASSTEDSEAYDAWVTRMRSLPATVVSTTLEGPLDWLNATLVRGVCFFKSGLSPRLSTYKSNRSASVVSTIRATRARARPSIALCHGRQGSLVARSNFIQAGAALLLLRDGSVLIRERRHQHLDGNKE
jgi:hypothetical protein